MSRPVHSLALAPLAASLLALSAPAYAGLAPAAKVSGNLVITDSDGYNWNLSFAPLLSIDSASGNIVVNTSLGANGISDQQGLWTASANTAGISVYDTQGHAFTPSTVVTWHSWLRADGTTGSDTAGGANPWRSSFSFYAAGNVDPDMSYAFSVKNNSAATQTYTYTQGESLVPSVAGAFTIYSDLSGSVNNTTNAGTPNLNFAPTAANGNKIQQVWLGNGNSATTNAGVGLGDAFSTSQAGSQTYGTFATTAAGNGSYDYWEFQVQFTLSGGKDLAQVTGFAEITPVPEPTTYALFGLGLAAVGLRVRRRAA